MLYFYIIRAKWNDQNKLTSFLLWTVMIVHKMQLKVLYADSYCFIKVHFIGSVLIVF